MDDDIFTGVHVVFRMIGESASVLVLSNAVGSHILYPCLGSLDKIPFIYHSSAKAGSVEHLDWKKTLSILGGYMKVTNSFRGGIRFTAACINFTGLGLDRVNSR